MKQTSTIFNAKILLFGEYVVIYGGAAITIPYTYFTGHLSFIGENKYTRYDMALQSSKDIVRYLDHYQANKELQNLVLLDIGRLRDDLNKGLYFESNIPQGYGVGSSGALIAALYKEYALEAIKPANQSSLKILKAILATMESFFHGTSSGMDPLNCLVGKPLLFKGNGEILKVNVPPESGASIFLVNSGNPANTEPLVNLFIEKAKDSGYRDAINNYLIPLNSRCIQNLIKGRKEDFFRDLHELSVFQYDNFREMIPSGLMDLWKRGIDSHEYKFKLCGSGGGGFILGFTRDFSLTEKIINEHGFEMLPA